MFTTRLEKELRRMPVKALVLHPEGEMEEVDLPDAVSEQLGVIQDILGGYAEALPIPTFIADGTRSTALVNEDGNVLQLKPNPVATEFMVPGRGVAHGRYIRGPLILVGHDPVSGDFKDVPSGMLLRARSIASVEGAA